MAFNITPAEYFKMLVEQHAEYTGDPLSLRKAIAVSMFANHLCEHIFAAYSGSIVQNWTAARHPIFIAIT